MSFLDSNGDGIGDLNRIISKLDYLESLGIDVLCYGSALYTKAPTEIWAMTYRLIGSLILGMEILQIWIPSYKGCALLE